MEEIKNTRVLLAERPVGEPQQKNFTIETIPVRELEQGEILIKVVWLSLDPYMRGRMSDAPSYAKPVEIGEVMQGESAGRVIATKSDKFVVGDTVTAHTGWQSHIISHESNPSVVKRDADQLPLSVYLHSAGMPGRTAYVGLHNLGKPQAGETLVVSAASGAVGSVVGQIGKIKGCRVVGVAGGPEKCAYVVNELGFDVCVDYKAGNLEQDLKEACPQGIDVYWENVGGAVTQAVAPLLNKGARVPVCGSIANYNNTQFIEENTPDYILSHAPNPPMFKFFVVSEYVEQWPEAMRDLTQWIKEGKIKYRESIIQGIESAPEGLRDLLRGQNFGKQLVRISEDWNARTPKLD
jgi:NADPH-dependent curcumin reductase